MTDIRLLTAEVLFAVIEADSQYTAEGINCVHDSTFHILLVWALEKSHSSIYIVKYLEFFRIFCRKANNLTLLNAILKTNYISDVSNFVLHRMSDQEGEATRKEVGFFIEEIVRCLNNIAIREECSNFYNEMKKCISWKYLHGTFIQKAPPSIELTKKDFLRGINNMLAKSSAKPSRSNSGIAVNLEQSTKRPLLSPSKFTQMSLGK